jgi:DNA-binding transcriptional ArsR family regulator
MQRQTQSALKPTLWRTCRVLASPVRLRILQVLLRGREKTVSALAAEVGISTMLASRYLRSLGARGLLAARRQSRWVYYRPAADPSVYGSTELLRALRKTLRGGRGPIDSAFRQATAFTHPRRIAIARALAAGALATTTLARRTGISRIALRRHLAKLSRRGLVKEQNGTWQLVRPRGSLATVLVRLACGQ